MADPILGKACRLVPRDMAFASRASGGQKGVAWLPTLCIQT
jgi:hypothetical protein